ncbi:MAG: hypothetical protein FWF29_06690 [Treponema sp.]|nr:hypothetical protein [Treponema sp.]
MRNISASRGAYLFAIFLTALISTPLAADSFSDHLIWSINGSILYFPEHNGNAGDPAPVLPSLGATLAFRQSNLLRLELTEDLYFTNYAYNYSLNRAVPAAIENRSAFVFGFVTGLQIQGCFPLGKAMDFRLYGGPAADFRVVALALNLHPDDFSGDPNSDAQIQTNSIRDYFWGKGRWFLPVAGAGMDFIITDNFLLGFDMRVWFPFYRLYTGENLPTMEGWRFGIGFRISPRKAKADPIVFSKPQADPIVPSESQPDDQ